MNSETVSKKKISIAIAVVIVMQILVLAGEYLGAVYPLWVGQEVKLKTVPIDPRSMFRGNYARLNYAISQVFVTDQTIHLKPRFGEIIYVSLKENEEGIHELSGASFNKPKSGLYIRGRVNDRWVTGNKYRVKYGIEAFFAPKEKALALEKDLRGGGVAVVQIASNGKPALKDVIPKS